MKIDVKSIIISDPQTHANTKLNLDNIREGLDGLKCTYVGTFEQCPIPGEITDYVNASNIAGGLFELGAVEIYENGSCNIFYKEVAAKDIRGVIRVRYSR